jgi:DNA transformation protein and related proteins
MADDMRNIGPKSRAWLAEIDISSLDDLREIGAVEAFARLRFRFGRKITRNMLHALAAALADIDWRQLSPQHKAELDRQVEERLARFDLTEI